MPPRIPQCRRQVCLEHVVRSNRQPTRSFNTSHPALASIPPESPRFIDIPQSLQPDTVHHKWVKGVLPIPKTIVSVSDPKHKRKVTPEYLAAVTPEPEPKDPARQNNHRDADYTSWKARQSAHRRQNLREGLIELHHREKRTVGQLAARSARKQRRNLQLRDAPERDDERLTSPTVLQSALPTRMRGLPDPNREMRLAMKQVNVADKDATIKEDRRHLLHTLYVNAGDFIVTDTQLEKAIADAFDNREQFKSDIAPGMNIWNLGEPETTRELLARSGPRAETGKALNVVEANERVTKERVKRIAEELTGGKI